MDKRGLNPNKGFINMNSENTRVKAEILSYLQDVVRALAVILLVFLLFFRIVVVSGSSMENTLIEGDYVVLVNNIFNHSYNPGDIIVASKDSFRDGESIIKRVIATEGQTVDINFEESLVYVDGVLLDEPYTSSLTQHYKNVDFPHEVPEGYVFVMGDNRAVSMDSRRDEIGDIETRQILGKAILLGFPGKDPVTGQRQFDRFGALYNGK